ncbi:MAG: TrmH family RNA methyltransferase, partial [Cyclobacteriaceae bacterium]
MSRISSLLFILVANPRFMISKAEIKYLRSLQLKKNRDKDEVFVLEGAKNLLELSGSDFEVIKLFATKDFYHKNEAKLSKLSTVVVVTDQQFIESAGTFKTNAAGLAIVRMKKREFSAGPNDWILALDKIQDPGNLGTIVRTADWFGISQVVCSPDTVDFYNPKVINATMGSFSRVGVLYKPLEQWLSTIDRPVYGALLEGTSIRELGEVPPGVILMGNESKGISDQLKNQVTQAVHIPRKGGAE